MTTGGYGLAVRANESPFASTTSTPRASQHPIHVLVLVSALEHRTIVTEICRELDARSITCTIVHLSQFSSAKELAATRQDMRQRANFVLVVDDDGLDKLPEMVQEEFSAVLQYAEVDRRPVGFIPRSGGSVALFVSTAAENLWPDSASAACPSTIADRIGKTVHHIGQ
ncbi:MAG: hypothetical protein ACYCZ0_01005 [Minisyncoccota bacterium]